MKVKMLLVVTLLVVCGSFASAQTFGFASTGGGLFCNFEQLASGGAGAWGGVDNLSACGASVNSTISGLDVTVPAHGQPTGGAGVLYGDSIYAALSGDPFAQWTVFTKLKCNSQNRFGQYTGNYGWNGVAAFSGFFAGGNHGYLSCTVPGRQGAVASNRTNTLAKKSK